MNRSKVFILAFTALVLAVILGFSYVLHQIESFPFRCMTFTRYDLSRKEGEVTEFAVTQGLRFESKHSGYLLLNGQLVSGSETMIINRRIVLSQGEKIDYNTYRYAISNIAIAANDTTPDKFFNILLAEMTLGPSYLQLNVDKVDDHSYLISGPLAYLFTCHHY